MWFRRDLRLHDNSAFHHSLCDCDAVYCTFCFDREILDKLEDRADRRVEFIHQSVAEMDATLRKRGVRLIVRHGAATEALPRLATELKVDRVYANHDYEPRRLARDVAVSKALAREGRELRTFKDHVIFERNEILTGSGTPFKVYTPYRNAWRAALTNDHVQPFPCEKRLDRLAAPPAGVRDDRWALRDLGFSPTDLRWPGGTTAGRAMLRAFLKKIDAYGETRNFPAVDGTSRLSVHLRFGTLSIRELVRAGLARATPGAAKWVDELIWREFYNMILHHFPHTQTRAFQPQYDDLPWRDSEKDFAAWCEGRTGYPIVDAGMRELNTTGYMHNRLRMIVASFLTKDLRISWRKGERYFARKLLDYDLSQNLGGWQWAASTGTDAQPYFRIFNPVSQSQKFDPMGEYIRRYVPELRGYPEKLIHAPWKAGELDQRGFGCVIGEDYPKPIVDHAEAREAALAMYRR